MSRDNFLEILKFLRFDSKKTRQSRIADKFAFISKIWFLPMENNQNCFRPYETIPIDKQLFPTKAQCRFTQYMPNKPDKFLLLTRIIFCAKLMYDIAF